MMIFSRSVLNISITWADQASVVVNIFLILSCFFVLQPHLDQNEASFK